jgi:phosphoglycerate dehydrogenase-like enzyme
MSTDPIHVVVAMDFSDEIIASIRAVSPRLHVERHFPKVPDKTWSQAEILYTLTQFPEPEQAARLRWVQMHSAGIDALFTKPIMAADSVQITTTSGIHATPIAEYCLMMMLVFNYRLPTMLASQAEGVWKLRDDNKRDLYFPHELRGQTLGIVG